MKRVRIGGQAVMEGVMMKNGDRYAVAVRKPDKDIEVKVVDYVSMASRSVFFRVPIIRGVVNFVESLVIGVKTLTYSASFYDDEEPEKAEKEKKEKKKERTPEQQKRADDDRYSVIFTCICHRVIHDASCIYRGTHRQGYR